MSDGQNKVCLVTGVGPGTGAALVRRFAQAGYKVAMIARSKQLIAELAAAVPNAHAYPCDVTDTPGLKAVVEHITSELGAPTIVVHNAVGGVFGDFLQIDPATLEANFAVNTMALLHLARLTVPGMIAAGGGSLLCTGNTSAYRGKAGFAGFAPTKAAQRVLLESIARRVGPEKVHVAYICVDAVIDLPWTRDRMPDKPDDFFCRPPDIADACFHTAHQPPSSWSFNVEIRPYCENW